jgi:hypothetical protein
LDEGVDGWGVRAREIRPEGSSLVAVSFAKVGGYGNRENKSDYANRDDREYVAFRTGIQPSSYADLSRVRAELQ